MLTYQEWQKTKRYVPDINEILGDGITGWDEVTEGYIYGGDKEDDLLSFIVAFKEGGKQFYELTIENYNEISSDLELFEEILYHNWVVPNSG